MNEHFTIGYMRAAINAITSRDVGALNALFKTTTFTPQFGFLDLPLPYSFTYHLLDCGHPLIRFGSSSPNSELTAVIVRFFEMLPLIERVSENPFDGQIVFNIGDEVGPSHIGFCSKYADAILIPDVEYIKYDAYREARRLFAMQPKWHERLDTPFWRGSSTGIRADNKLGSLPRVKLCRLGRKLGFDFAISTIYQSFNADEPKEIADIIGDHRPSSEFTKYKYHVDIDGNTSAWSALFLKLLSGGVVLKVASPSGYKQWYYDLLMPWVNFVPVATDMSDLEEAVCKLKANPELASRIGQNGRRLAQGLTWNREMSFAERKIFAVMLMQG